MLLDDAQHDADHALRTRSACILHPTACGCRGQPLNMPCGATSTPSSRR
jgi:hypothetical protein